MHSRIHVYTDIFFLMICGITNEILPHLLLHFVSCVILWILSCSHPCVQRLQNRIGWSCSFSHIFSQLRCHVLFYTLWQVPNCTTEVEISTRAFKWVDKLRWLLILEIFLNAMDVFQDLWYSVKWFLILSVFAMQQQLYKANWYNQSSSPLIII